MPSSIGGKKETAGVDNHAFIHDERKLHISEGRYENHYNII